MKTVLVCDAGNFQYLSRYRLCPKGRILAQKEKTRSYSGVSKQEFPKNVVPYHSLQVDMLQSEFERCSLQPRIFSWRQCLCSWWVLWENRSKKWYHLATRHRSSGGGSDEAGGIHSYEKELLAERFGVMGSTAFSPSPMRQLRRRSSDAEHRQFRFLSGCLRQVWQLSKICLQWTLSWKRVSVTR